MLQHQLTRTSRLARRDLVRAHCWPRAVAGGTHGPDRAARRPRPPRRPRPHRRRAATTVATGSTSIGHRSGRANGHTLYTFDKDTTPGQSACTSDACASKWPALTVTGTPTAGAGVGGALATFDRGGGTLQVTYNGKPLYFYAPDANAGDTGGDGFGGGIWHAAKPVDPHSRDLTPTAGASQPPRQFRFLAGEQAAGSSEDDLDQRAVRQEPVELRLAPPLAGDAA